MGKTWVVTQGKREKEIIEAYEKGIFGIGWEINQEDINKIRNIATKKEVKEYLHDIFENENRKKLGRDIGNIYRFMAAVVPGDYVISREISRSQIAENLSEEENGYLVGKVLSGPRLPRDDEVIETYWVIRSADWKFVSKAKFDDDQINSISDPPHTISGPTTIGYHEIDKLYRNI